MTLPDQAPQTQHTDAQDYELDYCLACNQMTNHVRKDECEKCLVTTQGEDELRMKVASIFNRSNNHNPGSRSDNISDMMAIFQAELSKQTDLAYKRGAAAVGVMANKVEEAREQARQEVLDELEVWNSSDKRVTETVTHFINAKRKKGN